MKRLLHIAMLFLALALSLLIEPNSLHSQHVDAVDYIQNVKQETVVLASNSLLGGEIYSNQEEETPNYSGNSPFGVIYVSNKTVLNKNKSQLNGSFVHNLSTNNQKVHQIRAP